MKRYLCQYCIEEIKSHGEKILVDPFPVEQEKAHKCEWCDEEDETLYKVIFK